MAELGPVQILVLGFEDGQFTQEVLDELRALRRADAVRLVDLLFVTKDDDGNVMAADHDGLTDDEIAQLGTIADALIGWSSAEDGLVAGALLGAAPHAPGEPAEADDGPLGEPDEWYIADGIPDGGSAAVVLIEHCWAVPLRDAVRRTGSLVTVDHFVHPGDLAVLPLANGHPPMLP
jgi:uncharacterized membrane protein